MMHQCALPRKCGKGVPVPVRSYLNANDGAAASAGIISPREPATLVATVLSAMVALLAAAF